MMELYGRQITLRNCGRFLHVASDFGSNYQTHPFLSQEMLYAGLTRERSRVPKVFSTAMEGYDFHRDFRVAELPLWFSVGILVDQQGHLLPKARGSADANLFNSLNERTPGIQSDNRFPKYGSMEAILPDNRFLALAVSPLPEHLIAFVDGQVYWMGKKRTMFQVCGVSELARGVEHHGDCHSCFVQIVPDDTPRFRRLQAIAGTQRYIVVRGEVADTDFVCFEFQQGNLGHRVEVPWFVLERCLLIGAMSSIG
jgi:hypothetical protein